jgi:hypothetical protein
MTEIPDVTRMIYISFLDFVHWVIGDYLDIGIWSLGFQLIAYCGMVKFPAQRRDFPERKSLHSVPLNSLQGGACGARSGQPPWQKKT